MMHASDEWEQWGVPKPGEAWEEWPHTCDARRRQPGCGGAITAECELVEARDERGALRLGGEELGNPTVQPLTPAAAAHRSLSARLTSRLNVSAPPPLLHLLREDLLIDLYERSLGEDRIAQDERAEREKQVLGTDLDVRHLTLAVRAQPHHPHLFLSRSRAPSTATAPARV